MNKLPKPYGWIALDRFFTDRQAAISAAEKTPVIDVWCRHQMLVIAAQRDEGLAREAELQRRIENADLALSYQTKNKESLQQHLAEAEKDAARYQWLRKHGGGSWSASYGGITERATNQVFDACVDGEMLLASPGCADGEKS